MGGTIRGNNVEIVDLPDSPLIMFIDIDEEAQATMPHFVVQMQLDKDPRATGLQPIDTGDLAFEHQLILFGTKANQILSFINLARRDILMELQKAVLIESITNEGLRATLELDEWEADDLVEMVSTAAEIVSRFYEHQSELAAPHSR